MNGTIPIPRFRCSVCQYPYPYMIPGGNCPCGGKLIDIEATLKGTQGLWYEEAFESFPCVIAHEYKRLHVLVSANNVYGAFLQLKDVIESTIKMIVLISASWGKARNVEGREEGYEQFFTTERLSLGAWVELARMVKRFYKEQSGESGLPSSLWKLLDKLPRWVNDNKLVNWRNEKLGHGAIGFEDNPEFQQDIAHVISVVTDFYRANREAFSSIQFASDGVILQGASHARMLNKETGNCSAVVDGISFSTESFVIHTDFGIYFFDEVVFRRQMRMLNYPMGKTKLISDPYTQHLYELRKSTESILETTVESEFLTRTENDFLARGGCGDQFIEPVFISDWLRQCLSEHNKGIMLLKMERGCGKTCYSEKLNRRFSGALELDDDLDVRTYHLSRTQIGGLREFINGVTSEWSFGYEKDPSADLARTASLRSDVEHPENNALYMAEYLGKVQQYTSQSDSRQRKKKILLVLDGIDEITERDDIIWSFIPSNDALPEGVYILLSGRIDTVEVSSILYANHIKSLSTCAEMVLQRSDEKYVEMLRRFIISKQIPTIDDSTMSRMINESDNRILYLSLLCDQCKLSGIPVFDESRAIVQTYLRTVESRYNEKQRGTLLGILSALTTVGAYESLSLKEISELNGVETINILFLDVMSDLLPLMRIERGFYDNGILTLDANRYAITNPDVSNAILDLYSNEIQAHITELIDSVRMIYSNQQDNCYVAGHLVLFSHLCDVAKRTSSLQDVQSLCFFQIIYKYVMEYNNVNTVNAALVRQRCLNAFRQVISISKALKENEIQKVSSEIDNSCYYLSTACEEERLYEEAIAVLEYDKTVLLATKSADKQDLALLYRRLGILYAKTYSSKAIGYLQKAIEMYSRIGKKSHSGEILITIAHLEMKLALLYDEMNRYTDADKLYTSAIERLRKIKGVGKQRDSLLCQAQINKASVLIKQKKANQAEALMRQAVTKTALLEEESIEMLAYGLSELSELYRAKGDYQRAYSVNQEALEIYERLQEESDEDTSGLELDIAKVHNNFGIVCRQLQKYAESLNHYEIALQIYEKYARISPSVYNTDVAMTSMNLANLKKELRDYPSAEQHYLKSYDIYLGLFTQDPGAWRQKFAEILLNFGMYYHRCVGNLNKAEPLYRQALSIYNDLSENNPGQYGDRVGQTMAQLGILLRCMRGKEDSEANALIVEGNHIVSAHSGITNHHIDPTILCNSLFTVDVKYLYCTDEQITQENGWCNESAEKVKEIRQSCAFDNAPDISHEEYNRQVAKSVFDQSEQVIVMRQIKLQFSQVMKDIVSIAIMAGTEELECGTARQLKAQKKYCEAGSLIAQTILNNKRLTTGTALEWFSVLAVAGDFDDAVRLVTVMSDAEGKGAMYHDDLMEELSCRRLLLYAAIEKYKGCDITKYLGILSDSPDTFTIDLEKVDTPIEGGTFTKLVEIVDMGNPEGVRQLFTQWESIFGSEYTDDPDYSKYSGQLRRIKETFRKAFDVGKMRIVAGKGISQMMQTAITLKRMGKYEESNEIYAQMVLKKKAIETGLAYAWFKCLAASGDILDALELARCILGGNVHDEYFTGIGEHYCRLVLCVEGINNHSPIDYLRKISGAPYTYSLQEKDLDVPCRSGVFAPLIEQMKSNMAIFNMMLDLLP